MVFIFIFFKINLKAIKNKTLCISVCECYQLVYRYHHSMTNLLGSFLCLFTLAQFLRCKKLWWICKMSWTRVALFRVCAECPYVSLLGFDIVAGEGARVFARRPAPPLSFLLAHQDYVALWERQIIGLWRLVRVQRHILCNDKNKNRYSLLIMQLDATRMTIFRVNGIKPQLLEFYSTFKLKGVNCIWGRGLGSKNREKLPSLFFHICIAWILNRKQASVNRSF